MFALVLAALLTIGVIRYNRERGPDLGRRIAVSPSTLVMSEHLIAFPSPLNVVVAKGPIRVVHVLDPSPSRREWSGSFEGRTVTLDSDVIAHRTVAAAKRYLATYEPRGAALMNAGGNEDAVGPYLATPHAAGAPDASHYFCVVVLSGGCASWEWSARYGQYTIDLVYVSIYPQYAVFMGGQAFESIIDAYSGQIQQVLG